MCDFNIFEWYSKFGCCRNKFRNFNCAVCYCHFFLIYFTVEPRETFFISMELGAKVKLHSIELIHCTYSIVCHFFHMDWIIQSFWLSFMGSSLLFWWCEDEKIHHPIRKCARFYVNQLRNILCLFRRLLFIIHIDHVKWIWPKIENDNKTLNLWQLFFWKHNIALLWTVSSLFFYSVFFSFHFYSVLLIVNFSHTESIASG